MKYIIPCLILLAALLLASAVQAETPEQASVIYWANAYNLNPDYMWRVALCESGGNPQAYNLSGAYGLYQYKSPTYYYFRDLLNADTTLAPGLTHYDPEYRDITSYDAQAHITAWAWAHGLSWNWECA